MQSFLAELHQQLMNRTEAILNNKILQTATLLDPRHKYDREYFNNWNEIEDTFCHFAYECKI